jgi:hypothetical protein
MDHINERTTANGHADVGYKLPTTAGGAEPLREQGSPRAAEQMPRQAAGGRDDGYIWRVTYVDAACSGGQPMTAVFDSESAFNATLDLLCSGGATIISAERANVTAWQVQQ